MLDYSHLQALLAVEKEGSFEGASKVLGMSPIGVASRIRKLEARMGVKLLSRKPTRPTEAGAALCEYSASIVDLEEKLFDEQRANGLKCGHDQSRLKIAITDDSLTCWFGKALGAHNADKDQPLLFDISLCDLDHSIDLMRNGEVIAALSSTKKPVHGFKSYRLGGRTYQAVASRDFIAQYFNDGVCPETLSQAPCLRHTEKDSHCLQWLEQQFETLPKLLSTRLPRLQLMIEMCLSGTAWSVLPGPKIAEHLESGSLVELIPDTPLSKTLYWHIAEAMSDPLSNLTKSVRSGFRS